MWPPRSLALRSSLPLEGAVLARGGPAQRTMWPPRSLALRSSMPLEGAVLAWGGPAQRTMWPPRSLTACSALPPEGAAAPATRQSRFRGPLLEGGDSTLAPRTGLRTRSGGRGSISQGLGSRTQGHGLRIKPAMTSKYFESVFKRKRACGPIRIAQLAIENIAKCKAGVAGSSFTLT